MRSRAHLYVFADFDGTLAPIASTPERALLPERARRVIQRLVTRPRTQVAIVSGRPVEALRRKLAVDGPTLIGNHGMELWAAGRRYEDPVGWLARPAIARLAARLAVVTAAAPGALLEYKGLSVTVHTRLVEPHAREALEAQVVAVAEQEPDVVCVRGKRVLELCPRGGRSKGEAALSLLTTTHGGEWERACAALFLGDDLTDEDGFRAVADRGAGVLVLDGAPRPTFARYTAAGLDDALDLLELIAG